MRYNKQDNNSNVSKYKREWAKSHKIKFAVDLNIDEYNELCSLLKSINLSKVQFVRDSFEELKKKKSLT